MGNHLQRSGKSVGGFTLWNTGSGASAFGEIDRVVRIDCRHENYSTIALPPDTAFWIFDTGIKHDLVDSLYGTRNQECMDALFEMRKIDDNLEHLAHGSLETAMNAGLPENLLKRVKHVIGEQERVKQFELGLKNATPLQELGKLLYESLILVHPNYSKTAYRNWIIWLNYLIRMMKFGARLTGGGFGGAVLAWSTHLFSQERANSIAQKYSDKFEVEPKFHSFNPSCGAHPKDPLDKG